jgi:hypothetical protein
MREPGEVSEGRRGCRMEGSVDRWDRWIGALGVGGTCGRVSSPLVRGMHGDVSLARLL